MGCGGCSGGGPKANSGNEDAQNGTSCASGDNDFYVVENASCKLDLGKLSRVNPDLHCKEIILSVLDCPTDFVKGGGAVGYLSLRTNNAVGGSGEAQPGQIYQVNLKEKTKTLINDGSDQVFLRPMGLAVIEDLTPTEVTNFCGENVVAQTLLMVADEGVDSADVSASDGGRVWSWCLNVDNLSQSLPPQPALTAGSDQMENPRGVAILNRSIFFATAQSPDDAKGLVLQKSIAGSGTAEIISDVFTNKIADIGLTLDGSPLVVDSGEGSVSKLNLGKGTRSSLTGLGGAKDALALSDEDRYFVTEFDAANVEKISLIEETETQKVTTDVILDGPMGISR